MSRSRSDMPAGWTATPAFHPEFGLLSPYARKRSGVPLPVLVIAVGIAVIATIGFASEHWGDGEARTTTVEQIHAPAVKAADICTTATAGDTEAAFLSSICGTSRLHARHHTRFSTVVLGRTALPPEHVAAAASLSSPTPTPEASAKVENEKSEKPPEQQASAKKPKAKSRTAAAQARELERQNAFDAFASGRRPGLAYAPRPMPPPWAYNIPFGPSW
jgi:hypothetical protein